MDNITDRPALVYRLGNPTFDGKVTRLIEQGRALRARGYAAPGAVDDPGRSCTRCGHPIPKEFRGIGLRIEDVLITTDGCAVLTAGTPKTVEEIERVCAEAPRLPR